MDSPTFAEVMARDPYQRLADALYGTNAAELEARVLSSPDMLADAAMGMARQAWNCRRGIRNRTYNQQTAYYAQAERLERCIVDIAHMLERRAWAAATLPEWPENLPAFHKQGRSS